MAEVRVLLVEDNPADARLVVEMLREARGILFHTETVARLQEALARLRSSSADVLLLDLGLPDAQGLEALHAVRREAEHVPTIILSGLRDDEAVARAAELGAQDYLIKGRFDADVLVRSIRYAIERTKAARALRDSERRYGALFANSLDGVALHEIVNDADGRAIDYVFLEVNDAFETLTGLRSENVIGRRVTEVLPGIEKDPFIETYGRVVATGEGVRFEAFATPLGRHYDIAAFPCGEGRFATIFTDVTERNQAEERLRLQGAVLEAAADAVLITDREGRIVWVNDAFHRLTGWSLDECRGQTPRILKSGDHDRSFYSEMWQTILQGGVWQHEMRNRRKDGELYVEEQTITPVKDERGEITHFVAIKRDIGERKRAELALLESEERYRTLAEASQDDISIVDAAGRILYLNANAAGRLGLPPEEVVGRNLEELLPAEVTAGMRSSIARALSSSRPVYVERLVPFPTG